MVAELALELARCPTCCWPCSLRSPVAAIRRQRRRRALQCRAGRGVESAPAAAVAVSVRSFPDRRPTAETTGSARGVSSATGNNVLPVGDACAVSD